MRGVSRQLVSPVFRDGPGSSESSRELALAAAAALDFRPNASARLLRQNHTRTARGGSGSVPAGTVSTEPASSDVAARERFIEGFVTASLVFCVGPLTILGSLSDGLGRGADQLILKAALDGFAAIAFAAALGAGVMASVVAIVVVQGSLTLVGVLAGSALPEAQLASITATGGLLLLGVGLRLLQIKAVPVGNLLPALLVAPALVWIVAAFR